MIVSKSSSTNHEKPMLCHRTNILLNVVQLLCRFHGRYYKKIPKMPKRKTNQRRTDNAMTKTEKDKTTNNGHKDSATRTPLKQ
jgi:hypothetical protein